MKLGNEHLCSGGKMLPFTLLDFWRWNASNLLSNAMRGVLAEFIVATAANVDIQACREEWARYDLVTREGIKVEVKSAAYLQSWYQRAFSTITFSIKAAMGWDSETNTQTKTKSRHADLYVFCLLHHQDKATVDPLNMDHWCFYVLSTNEVNAYERSQHSITLKSLERLTRKVRYEEVYHEIQFKYDTRQERI